MNSNSKSSPPCNASARWPLGYWVVDEGHFDSAEELRAVLGGIVERNMSPNLKPAQLVRLRPDLICETTETDILFRSRWIKITFHQQTETEQLANMLAAGIYTAADFALKREREAGVSLPETFLFLDNMLKKGLLDEEPYHMIPVKLERAAG